MKTDIKISVKTRLKKLVSLLLVCIGLTSLLAGCGSKGNTLFDSAAPDSSALIMYKYGYTQDGSDRKEGTQYSMYTAAIEKELLAELSRVNVKEVDTWSSKELEFPIYGMWIGTTEGNSLKIAWTGDYLVTEEGKVYEFDIDMEDLLSRYEWRDVESFTNATFFPCSRVLSLSEDGWTPTLLKEVGEMNAPEDITMELVERDGNLFTVKLTNNTDEDWCYGTYFSVQALIDGTWHDIPTKSGNWAFTDIAMMLAPGASVEETYNIGMYGDLPAGTYRLEVEDIVVEFKVGSFSLKTDTTKEKRSGDLLDTESFVVENILTGAVASLTAEDGQQISAILAKEGWKGGTTDCLVNCKIYINGQMYTYHSDCGSFQNSEKNCCFILSDEDADTINSILAKYISLSHEELPNE